MIVFAIFDSAGVDATFVANDDELTVVQIQDFRARLGKIGWHLARSRSEPARELASYVKWLEEESQED